VMTWFGNMLITLGQVPGFGWATDAGNKILDTAKQVAGLSSQIRNIPVGEVVLNVTTNYSAVTAQILGAARGSLKLAIMPAAEGVTVLPTPGGTLLRVAEAGRPESVVDTGKVNALINQALQPASSSPNGPIRLHPDDIKAIGAVILAGAGAVAAGAIGANARELMYGGN